MASTGRSGFYILFPLINCRARERVKMTPGTKKHSLKFIELYLKEPSKVATFLENEELCFLCALVLQSE